MKEDAHLKRKHEAWVLATLNFINGTGITMGNREIPAMLSDVTQLIVRQNLDLARANTRIHELEQVIRIENLKREGVMQLLLATDIVKLTKFREALGEL